MPQALARWMALWVVVLVSAGCGSGSSSGSSDAPPANSPPAASAPELANLSPTQLVLEVDSGEQSSAQITFRNSGDAVLTYDLTTTETWITLPGNAAGSLMAGASVSLTLSVTCDGADESGSLTLATNDADEGNVGIPVSVTCVVLSDDYQVSRLTLNQAARAFDSDLHSTPAIGLVAGRELLVRAFVTGTGTVPDAQAVIVNPGQADQVFAMQTPTAVGPLPADESVLSASHYVVVPGSAVSVGAELRVEVNPEGAVARFPDAGSLNLNVADPGRLNVTLVPVLFEGQTPSLDGDTYLRQTLQQMPVGDHNVLVRAPYVFTGDYDLDRLLDEMADLRSLDGSIRLYHGVIIPPDSSGSFTAGIGYVGFPVSVSVDLGGTQNVISHEIGHNLNLGHAPGCDAPGADPDYPYADGAVTTWGFNIINDSLVAPTTTRRDLMSYCSSVWISDYHFNAALDFRVASPVSSSGDAGLHISGRVQHDQVASLGLLPVEHVIQHLAPQLNARYRFTGWDASGRTVVDAAFAAHEVADVNAPAGFSFTVPAPDAPLHHYQIALDGAVVHTAQVSAVQAATPAQINWRNGAAEVMWTPSAGQSLILRDSAGQVVSVDRSGRARVPVSGVLQVDLVQHGVRLGAHSIRAGADQVLEMVR